MTILRRPAPIKVHPHVLRQLNPDAVAKFRNWRPRSTDVPQTIREHRIIEVCTSEGIRYSFEESEAILKNQKLATWAYTNYRHYVGST